MMASCFFSIESREVSKALFYLRLDFNDSGSSLFEATTTLSLDKIPSVPLECVSLVLVSSILLCHSGMQNLRVA